MAYEDQIYKRPDTGKYYSIVNGTAREFNDQEAAAQLAPNAQSLSWGKNTTGYDPRHGGGTVGFGWSTADFTKQVGFQAQNAALNQAAEQAAAISNAQAPAANPNAPTDFQKYFQAELAKGRAAGDILSNNPFMAGQPQGPAQIQAAAAPSNPAQVVTPPPTTYKIQKGDTLSGIAKKYGTDVNTLMKLNPNIKNANLIQAGAGLNLPSQAPAQNKPAGTITADQMQQAKNIDLGTSQQQKAQGMAESKAQAEAGVSEAAAKSKSLTDKMAEITPPETELDRRKKALLDQIVNSNQETAKIAAQQLTDEQAAGIPEKKAAIAANNSEILTKTAEYKQVQASYDQLTAEQRSKPVTMNTIIGAEAQINMVKQGKLNSLAAEIGILQAKSLGLQGEVDSAQKTVDRAIDLKFKIQELNLDTYKAQLDAIQPELDQKEKIRAEVLSILTEEKKQALLDSKTEEKNIQGVVLEAIKSGITDSKVLNQIGAAKSYDQALQIYGKNALEKAPNLEVLGQDSLGNDIKGYFDTKTGSWKTLNSQGKFSESTDGIESPSYITEVINVITGSSKLTKDQKNSFIQAVQSGQDPLIVIKNQAKNLLGAAIGGDLTKLEAAKEQMVSLQSLIKEYYQQGGETGLFTGNMEKVQNKFGQVNDPKLVEVATNIQAALQAYRNAISGTAYSVQEGQDIASVFPGINKTEGLNAAIIKGRLGSFETSIDSLYRSALGDVYDTAKAASLEASIDTSALKPIRQSFASVKALLIAHPEYTQVFEIVANKYPNASDAQLQQFVSAYGPNLENGGSSAQVSKNLSLAYKVGQDGGQCGEFIHNLVEIPNMGNYYSEKQKSVQKNGIVKAKWTPKVGDVVITDGSDVSASGGALTYGHAAVVTEVKPNGDLVLIESNARGDERVTKGRIINKNDAAVYGALRGQIKQKYLS